MKNINPEGSEKVENKTGQGNEPESSPRSFSRTLIIFIAFFLVNEFLIIKPLRKKLVEKQKEQENSELVVADETNDGDDSDTNNVAPEYVNLENDYIKLVINTKGLLLDNLTLKKYTENNENIKLLELENSIINIGWLPSGDGLKIPNKNSIWTRVEQDNSNEDGRKIVFSYDNGEHVVFKIILSLDDKYMINVEQIVKNETENRLSLKPLWQIEKKNHVIKNRNEMFSFNGGIGVFDDKIYEIKAKKVKNNNVEFLNFSWAGITEKYWLMAIVNKNLDNGQVNFIGKNNKMVLQYTTKKNREIAGKSTESTGGSLFVGAKDSSILKYYVKNNNIKLLDRSIDFGVFHFLARPMNALLNLLYKITKNFGLAIILLTIIIKAILYPMVKKSFITMNIMKEIQPKIRELQIIYSDDNVRLHHELVKLYGKYQLNPFASLLPIFIQIPVFLSLYKVISVSLNMRQAPFFWFIKDLSANDPSNTLNLFGLLPFNPNFKLGILPCVMAITMYLQQKSSENMMEQPTPPDVTSKNGIKIHGKDLAATNKKLTRFMPLLFMFMFSSFPSGLLLYWILNNIITIFQQYHISNICYKSKKF
ncbi:membrane protein insertase YidC [Bacilli bacterium]|nr:membrane protein insertase YidC [Bacilli bacterium]